MSDAQRMSMVVDTSVLINFLTVNRLDLLAQHPEFQFLITEHVHSEVATYYITQLPELESALNNQILQQIRIEGIQALSLFGQLIKNPRLALGECAAITEAISRPCALALDDKVARKVVRESFPDLAVLDTEAITVSMIRGEMLSVEEADSFKNAWTNASGFRHNSNSFAELLG